MSSQPLSGLRIGSIAGAPVRIGASWLLLALLVIVTSGSNLARQGNAPGLAYGVAAGMIALLGIWALRGLRKAEVAG